MANRKHIKWLLQGVESWNKRRKKKPFRPDLSDINLYTEFKKAGKLDCNGNIPLKKVNLIQANFSNCRLSYGDPAAGVDFSRAHLVGSNFSNASLRQSNMVRAVLSGINLDNADLCCANLRDSVIADASMRNTNLTHADCREAELPTCDLENAELCYAKLTGTELVDANLKGADLMCSAPWEADLFKLDDSTSCGGGRQESCTIECIAGLTLRLSELKDQYLPGREFYFRGESNEKWDLRPSVMREKNGEFPYRDSEATTLLELISQRPEDFSGTRTALEQWVLAQHHGLKTRLLDITRNPLVALMGACGRLGDKLERADSNGCLHVFCVPRNLIKPFNSDTMAVVANLAKLSREEQDYLLGARAENDPHSIFTDEAFDKFYDDIMRRLYHFIQQERPTFSERIDPRDFFRVFVVEPLQSFNRIRAQSGAFLVSAYHERFEQSEILDLNPGTPIYDHFQFQIPVDRKEQILRELQLLNVKRETLFPELGEVAKAITDRLENPNREIE